MIKEDLNNGDKVIITNDICYRKIVGKEAEVLQRDIMLSPNYCIVRVDGEIHAVRFDQIRKV